MGKSDIDGVTKTRFASIADGEEWSQQVQQSQWFKSRLFINRIQIVLWIRLTLFVLEKQIRSSKIANLFANDGDVENDALETGSVKDFAMAAGAREQKHRTDMKEADFEYQKDVIKESKNDTANLSMLFFALKKGVKYSYLIFNGIILAFIVGFCVYSYQRAQYVAELNSKANADIAHVWYEPGQKTYESIINEFTEGTVMKFNGEMNNGFEFDMTLCVNDKGEVEGAYIYTKLQSVKDNIPERIEQDFDDDGEDIISDEEEKWSEYLCAALPLKGKMKGELEPGKKITLELYEYDSNNRKIGTFKGNGTFNREGELESLRIEGTFKNHEGQKNKFFMNLASTVKIESFKAILDGLQKRKAIRKVLHYHEGNKPYAIIVNRDKEIKLLTFVNATTDYEEMANDLGSDFGEYDKENVIVKDDYILIRSPYGGGTYNNGIDPYTPAIGVMSIDLRGDMPKTSNTIKGVIWDESRWESQNKFYVVDTEGMPTVITGYNQYGEIVSSDSLPIFHAYIPAPGFIVGECYADDDIDDDFSFGGLITKYYDFDGKEIDEGSPEPI